MGSADVDKPEQHVQAADRLESGEATYSTMTLSLALLAGCLGLGLTRVVAETTSDSSGGTPHLNQSRY